MTDTVVVLDTETNGTDGATDALLEAAWVALERQPDGWAVAAADSVLVEFAGPLNPEARAVHHLTPAEVAPGAPGTVPRDALLHTLLAAETDELCYAAHNAPFDQGFLPELTRPWIDTLQCARHIWPDAPRHGNQVLRYWLGAEPEPSLIRGLAPHRALYDTACTAAFLLLMLRDHEPEELVRLSTTPLLLRTCHLKKYRDVPWAEVPRDYLRWITTTDMLKDDVNLRYTVEHYLGRV